MGKERCSLGPTLCYLTHLQSLGLNLDCSHRRAWIVRMNEWPWDGAKGEDSWNSMDGRTKKKGKERKKKTFSRHFITDFMEIIFSLHWLFLKLSHLCVKGKNQWLILRGEWGGRMPSPGVPHQHKSCSIKVLGLEGTVAPPRASRVDVTLTRREAGSPVGGVIATDSSTLWPNSFYLAREAKNPCHSSDT